VDVCEQGMARTNRLPEHRPQTDDLMILVCVFLFVMISSLMREMRSNYLKQRQPEHANDRGREDSSSHGSREGISRRKTRQYVPLESLEDDQGSSREGSPAGPSIILGRSQ